MSSSTSNSSIQYPSDPVKAWLLILLLCGLLLGGWESYWRSQDYLPSVGDGPANWSNEYETMAEKGAVIVGASQADFAMHAPALRSVFGGRAPAQLAMWNGTPLPVLEHIANSSDFGGVVLVDAADEALFVPVQDWMQQHILSYITYPETNSWSVRQEDKIRTFVQAHFASLAWRLRIRKLLQIATGRPEIMSSHGIRQTDFIRQYWGVRGTHRARLPSRHPTPEFRNKILAAQVLADEREVPPTTLRGEALEERLQMIASMVGNIQQRGGTVVFIRFPTDGPVAAIQKEHWPRAEFFDRLAETGAKLIHFEDYPSLDRFETYDRVHIRLEQKVAFTEALAEILNSVLAEH